MNEVREFRAFAENLQQDVFSRADAEQDGALRAETFAEVAFEYLRESGEIDDGIACSFEGHGMRCSGYFISEDNDRLDLFLVVPRLDAEASTVGKTEIDQAFRRLRTFLEKALEGLHSSLESAARGNSTK